MKPTVTAIRLKLAIFIAVLAISGLTALPLTSEVDFLAESVNTLEPHNFFREWITSVQVALHDIQYRYPFVNYGTDWLAFGHLVISMFFIGPFKEPLKNQWVVKTGMIACCLVIPTAIIMGTIRSIPFFWQCIDCSFGVIGGLFLWNINEQIQVLQEEVQVKKSEP